jgi:hypothetical protein
MSALFILALASSLLDRGGAEQYGFLFVPTAPRSCFLRIASNRASGSVLVWVGKQPEMIVIRRQARLERPRPAEPLKLRRDLGVIQVGMIAATRADELERAGVTAFHPAIHDAGRLAPQARRAAMAGLAGKRECHDALGTDAQPRVRWFRPAARLPGRTRTGTGHDVYVRETAHIRPQAKLLATLPGLGQRC